MEPGELAQVGAVVGIVGGMALARALMRRGAAEAARVRSLPPPVYDPATAVPPPAWLLRLRARLRRG